MGRDFVNRVYGSGALQVLRLTCWATNLSKVPALRSKSREAVCSTEFSEQMSYCSRFQNTYLRINIPLFLARAYLKCCRDLRFQTGYLLLLLFLLNSATGLQTICTVVENPWPQRNGSGL